MSSINKDVKYTLSLRDLMTAGLIKAKGDVDKLDSSVVKTNTHLRGLKDAAMGIGRSLGIGFGIAGVVGFGKEVIDSLKNYEYFSDSLRTLMNGDAAAAGALQTQLISLAAKTPFSLVEVQDATKQLIAYGFNAGAVTKNISMLGDVAAALKIPFGDIAYLYGTLKTQGRAYSKDIMQFTQRGIPVIAELAKQYKTTESNVMKLVEAGKVGFPQVEKAFQSMTGKGGMFFKMMEEQSKTVGGKISNLGDVWEQLKVNIGRSQSGIIAGTVDFLNESLAGLSQYFSKANRMAEDFKDGKARDFNWLEKITNETIGVVTGYNLGLSKIVNQEDFQLKIYGQADKSSKSLIEAFKIKAQLLREQVFLVGQLAAKQIDYDTYARKRATIKGGLEAVQGNINLFSVKGKKEEVVKGEIPTITGAGSGQPKAPKYTHIEIKFNNVVQTLEIQNNTPQDLRRVADKVVELLTTTLNDSQRMAAQ